MHTSPNSRLTKTWLHFEEICVLNIGQRKEGQPFQNVTNTCMQDIRQQPQLA